MVLNDTVCLPGYSICFEKTSDTQTRGLFSLLVTLEPISWTMLIRNGMVVVSFEGEEVCICHKPVLVMTLEAKAIA